MRSQIRVIWVQNNGLEAHAISIKQIWNSPIPQPHSVNLIYNQM